MADTEAQENRPDPVMVDLLSKWLLLLAEAQKLKLDAPVATKDEVAGSWLSRGESLIKEFVRSGKPTKCQELQTLDLRAKEGDRTTAKSCASVSIDGRFTG